AVVAGAVAATAGLFLSLVLTNSRLPFVLALQGTLPQWLAAPSTRTGGASGAAPVSCAAYSGCAPWSFRGLVSLHVVLYSLPLLLEMAAFVALRLRDRELSRPFRMGGGLTGFWLTALLPSAAALLAMATAGWLNTMAGLAAALTGPAAWLWRRARSARAGGG